MSKSVKAFEVKTIFLGESGVGKTNLIKAAIDEKFDPNSKTNLTASFMEKTVKINKKYYLLKLWDTIGQEKFRTMTKLFYKGSKIVIFVYDITNMKSFEELEYWVNEVKTALGDEPIYGLVGNKSDLYEEEQVNEEKARDYESKKNIKFKIVSAKTNQKDFQLFLEELLKDYIEKTKGKIKEDQVVQIEKSTSTEKKKGFC